MQKYKTIKLAPSSKCNIISGECQELFHLQISKPYTFFLVRTKI